MLARLGRSVIGLEPEPELAEAARGALREIGIVNADIVEGPLGRGDPEGGPYDVILLNGSVPEPPESLIGATERRRPARRRAVERRRDR